ncbi:MAG: hypothetical protein O3A00_12655 [Planctomycetota bacterium]|nr:hypothetical protein [Planctomycetota bacterium]
MKKSWPLASEYSNMLQNPQVAFRDPDLKNCVIERDNNNQPRARAGAFANVYKGTTAGGADFAIRVFTSSSEARHNRYSLINSYLQTIQNRWLVGINYLEEGIRVVTSGGVAWFPLMTMEWVPGDIMFDWVRTQCHGGNAPGLRNAADQWVQLVGDLRKSKIAHGDLQHGNVMITPNGELKLVDYDCMCVPELVGAVNEEIGVVPYQHPERDANTKLSIDLDNFSSLYILVALRAFAADPGLWQQYNEPPGKELYDKLLFREEDFQNAGQSRVFRELQRSPDPDVVRWTRDLFGLVRVSMAKVPPLEHFVNDTESVKELLDRGAWDAAVEMAQRGNIANAAPAVVARLRQAQQRVDCRERLEAAVKSGDEEAMLKAYDPKLLDDYPEAQQAVGTARGAAKVIPILRQLKQLKAAGQSRQYVATWDKYQTALAGRRSGKAIQKDVEAWRKKNKLADRIQAGLGRPDVDAPALTAAWQALAKLGGHPDVNDRRTEIEKLLHRDQALQRFRDIPNNVTPKHDRALKQAWNETLFAGWKSAEAERPRLKAALERLAALNKFEALVKQAAAAVTLVSEKGVYDLGNALSADYHNQGDRVILAHRRLYALQTLEQAAKQKPPSEQLLAQAWKELQALDASDLVNAQVQARLNQASDIAPLLEQLQRISLRLPPNELDRQLLAVWDDTKLSKCVEASAWRVAWDEARQRKPLLKQLETAIQNNDDELIARCCQSALFKGWPFSSYETDRISKAIDAIEGIKHLVEALRSGDRPKFVELFDIRHVQKYPREFADFRDSLVQWIDTEILDRELLGLRPPIMGNAVRPMPGGTTFQVRWTWPSPRYTTKCLLKICPSQPGAETSPDDVRAHQTFSLDREMYEKAGGYRRVVAKPNWLNSYAVVWAMIDLGFAKLYSQPLVLGRLGPRSVASAR